MPESEVATEVAPDTGEPDSDSRIEIIELGKNRGSNVARIATLILIIPAILGTATSFGMGSRNGETALGVDGRVIEPGDPIGQAIPGWFASLSGGLGCLQVLGYIAVLVLLLLPASNLYFRRRPSAAQT